MKRDFFQESHTFKLRESSKEGKVSSLAVFVVVFVAAARLKLRFPSFQTNFKPF